MKFNFGNINSIRDIVRQAVRYKKSGNALDLGSGVGRHSLFLAKKGFHVTAIDNSSENLAALKELARIQNLPIKTEKIDLNQYKPSKKYDFIVSTMVLHFISHPLQKKSITVMQDFTKPLGVNVVSNYSDKNPKATRPYLINAEKLKKQYTENGWKIVHYQEYLSEPMTKSDGSKKTVRYWITDLIAQKV